MEILNAFDKLEKAVEEEKIKDSKPKDSKYKFDYLKMYFGEPRLFKFRNAEFNVYIPTIADVIDVGEEQFYRALSPFLKNPTSMRVFLYDALHKDWNKTKDIELFFILINLLEDKEPLKLFFHDEILWNDFVVVDAKFQEDSDDGSLALYSESQNILIYEDELMELMEYIRTILNIHPKVEKAKGKSAKLWILQEDRMKAQEEKDNSSILLPYISSLINHSGFKYSLEELKSVNIYMFMDSVNRIQKYEQGIAALHGIYSGFVSAKDLPDKLLDFMGDI